MDGEGGGKNIKKVNGKTEKASTIRRKIYTEMKASYSIFFSWEIY